MSARYLLSRQTETDGQSSQDKSRVVGVGNFLGDLGQLPIRQLIVGVGAYGAPSAEELGQVLSRRVVAHLCPSRCASCQPRLTAATAHRTG